MSNIAVDVDSDDISEVSKFSLLFCIQIREFLRSSKFFLMYGLPHQQGIGVVYSSFLNWWCGTLV